MLDSGAFARRVLVADGGLTVRSGAVGSVIVGGNQGIGNGHGRSQRGDWGQRGDEKSGEGRSVDGNEERSGDERHRSIIHKIKRVAGLNEGATSALGI